MNAARNVVGLRPRRIDPLVAERVHRATISVHRPNEPEDIMAYRVALAELRDRAGAGLARCCPEAMPLLQAVSSQAAMAVYAPLPARKLFAIRAALDLTMMAARQIEWAVGLNDGR